MIVSKSYTLLEDMEFFGYLIGQRVYVNMVKWKINRERVVIGREMIKRVAVDRT